jgi:outer membrane protein OmpA-like peptidoglycan-associated protein
MAINLLDLVKGYLTPDVVEKAASFVGESPSATQSALSGGVPAIIGALSEMASTRAGADQIGRMLDAGKFDGSALTNPAGFFSASGPSQSLVDTGKGLLGSLFGGKASGVADLIGQSAGIRASSATSLLGLAAGLVMNVLGRQRSSMGLDASGLASLLGDQRSMIAGLLPAGVASLLGWKMPGVAAAAAAVPSGLKEVGPAARGRQNWWLPLGILAALVVAAWAYLANRPAPVPVAQAPAAMTDMQLPCGAKISVPQGSFDMTLAQWLSNTSDTAVPKRFVFDHLNFETGTTTLTADSTGTVDSLVAILKCFPQTQVQLDGYTDNTGDAAANKKLSLDRATAVKDLLVKGGIEESRMTTQGLGQDNPVASNDTEEGKAKNRRLELVVQKR